MAAILDTHDTAPPLITDPPPEYKHERPNSGVALSPPEAQEFHSAARESELHSSTIAPATSAGETPNFRLSLEDIVKGALRAPYSPENSIEEPSDEEGVNNPFELARYRPYLENRSDDHVQDHPGQSTSNVKVGQGQWWAVYSAALHATTTPPSIQPPMPSAGVMEEDLNVPVGFRHSQEALPTMMDGATDNASLPESENVPPRRPREERRSGTHGTNADKANRHNSVKSLLGNPNSVESLKATPTLEEVIGDQEVQSSIKVQFQTRH